MQRRDILRTTAATLGGAGAAAAVLSLPEDAAAEASAELDIAGDQATLDADGQIAAVWLDASVGWAYDLPDSAQPSTVIVELAADGETVAAASRAELFPTADGEETFSVDLLANGPLTADGLTPDDGERATEVEIEARLAVESGDGTLLAEDTATDTATVTVKRDGLDPTEYGAVAGSGALTIEIE